MLAMLVNITASMIKQDKVLTFEYEDISHYELTENEIILHPNTGSDQTLVIRSNDGVGDLDWASIVITCTRKAMTFG